MISTMRVGAHQRGAHRESHGKVLGEDRPIRHVHLRDSRHVRQEGGRFDNVGPGISGSCQGATKARQHFVRLCLHVSLVRRGVARHAGHVQPAADLNRRTQIRAGTSWCAVRIRRNDLLPVRILDRHHGDLDEIVCARQRGLRRGARRRRARKVRPVLVVHRLESRRIRNEDARRDDIGQGHAGGLENRGCGRHDRLGLHRHVTRDVGVVDAIAADEPSQKQRVAGLDAVAVRTRRREPAGGLHHDPFAASRNRGNRQLDESAG